MTQTRARRRPRRRRQNPARTYSLRHLIDRQPKTLHRLPEYQAALRHFRANPRLQQTRISARAYTLLNQARLGAENLHHFYRTYRLSPDPFFPLFLTAKRAYDAERQRIKAERRTYIIDRMRGLPPGTLAMVRYLGYLERMYNGSGQSPVWQRELYPSSKRVADRLAASTDAAWFARFQTHLRALQARYPALTEVVADRVLAAYLLELDEVIDHERLRAAGRPPQRPDRAAVTRAYRKQSLRHHPDRGGDHAQFIRTKWARDVLTGDGS